jgi:hypothetical protein
MEELSDVLKLKYHEVAPKLQTAWAKKAQAAAREDTAGAAGRGGTSAAAAGGAGAGAAAAGRGGGRLVGGRLVGAGPGGPALGPNGALLGIGGTGRAIIPQLRFLGCPPRFAVDDSAHRISRVVDVTDLRAKFNAMGSSVLVQRQQMTRLQLASAAWRRAEAMCVQDDVAVLHRRLQRVDPKISMAFAAALFLVQRDVLTVKHVSVHDFSPDDILRGGVELADSVPTSPNGRSAAFAETNTFAGAGLGGLAALFAQTTRTNVNGPGGDDVGLPLGLNAAPSTLTGRAVWWPRQPVLRGLVPSAALPRSVETAMDIFYREDVRRREDASLWTSSGLRFGLGNSVSLGHAVVPHILVSSADHSPLTSPRAGNAASTSTPMFPQLPSAVMGGLRRSSMGPLGSPSSGPHGGMKPSTASTSSTATREAAPQLLSPPLAYHHSSSDPDVLLNATASTAAGAGRGRMTGGFATLADLAGHRSGLHLGDTAEGTADSVCPHYQPGPSDDFEFRWAAEGSTEWATEPIRGADLRDAGIRGAHDVLRRCCALRHEVALWVEHIAFCEAGARHVLWRCHERARQRLEQLRPARLAREAHTNALRNAALSARRSRVAEIALVSAPELEAHALVVPQAGRAARSVHGAVHHNAEQKRRRQDEHANATFDSDGAASPPAAASPRHHSPYGGAPVNQIGAAHGAAAPTSSAPRSPQSQHASPSTQRLRNEFTALLHEPGAATRPPVRTVPSGLGPLRGAANTAPGGAAVVGGIIGRSMPSPNGGALDVVRSQIATDDDELYRDFAAIA